MGDSKLWMSKRSFSFYKLSRWIVHNLFTSCFLWCLNVEVTALSYEKVRLHNSSPSTQICTVMMNYCFSLQNVLNSVRLIAVMLCFCLLLCNQILLSFGNLCSQLQLFVVLGCELCFYVDQLKISALLKRQSLKKCAQTCSC